MEEGLLVTGVGGGCHPMGESGCGDPSACAHAEGRELGLACG